MVSWQPLKFDQYYDYPVWATGIGVVMMLSSIMFVPGVAIYRLLMTQGTLKQVIQWKVIGVKHI